MRTVVVTTMSSTRTKGKQSRNIMFANIGTPNGQQDPKSLIFITNRNTWRLQCF